MARTKESNSAVIKSARPILVFITLFATVTGCGPNNNEPEGNNEKAYLDPDPGNRRLAALKKEPALELVPPGAKLKSHKVEPKKVGEAFSSNLGVGPSITRIFAPKDDPINVEATLTWFHQRLVELGWARNSVEESLSRFPAPASIYRKQIDHWCASLRLLSDAPEAKAGELVLRVSTAASLYPEQQQTCVDYPSPDLKTTPSLNAEQSS